MIIQLLFFSLAALLEIVGCWLMLTVISERIYFSVTSVLSILCLLTFAIILSKVDLGFAGKTYAAYGGIYIATAFVWYVLVDDGTPSVYDILGVLLSILGSIVILFGFYSNNS